MIACCIFIDIFRTAPESMAFAPRGALTFLPAILGLSASATFGKFPGIGLPFSTHHWGEIVNIKTGQ